MSFWPVSRRRDRDSDLDRGYWGSDLLNVDPFDIDRDVNREFRRLNRQMRRLERDLLGDVGFGPSLAVQSFVQPSIGFGGLNQLANVGSLINQALPILPNYVEQGGKKLLQFQVDTTGFRPEDIEIKTEGDKLTVMGKHEERSGDIQRYREFRRMVNIPQGAKVEEMKSRLTPDGLLVIETPFEPKALEQQQQQAIELPIRHVRGQQQIGQRQETDVKRDVEQGKETSVAADVGRKELKDIGQQQNVQEGGIAA